MTSLPTISCRLLLIINPGRNLTYQEAKGVQPMDMSNNLHLYLDDITSFSGRVLYGY